MVSIKEVFDLTVKWVNTSNINITDEEKLKCYGYYKQAIEGDNQASEPWSIYFEQKAKWNAWEANKGMSKDNAMRSYITFIQQVRDKYKK